MVRNIIIRKDLSRSSDHRVLKSFCCSTSLGYRMCRLGGPRNVAPYSSCPDVGHSLVHCYEHQGTKSVHINVEGRRNKSRNGLARGPEARVWNLLYRYGLLCEALASVQPSRRQGLHPFSQRASSTWKMLPFPAALVKTVWGLHPAVGSCLGEVIRTFRSLTLLFTRLCPRLKSQEVINDGNDAPIS